MQHCIRGALDPPCPSLQGSPCTLHDAAKVGDCEALQRLLEEPGCDVNGKDARGITALGVAVGFNRIPCVKALLAAGADVTLTDNRGSTVLHYAAGEHSRPLEELQVPGSPDT